jgi:hypothetical protein
VRVTGLRMNIVYAFMRMMQVETKHLSEPWG